MFKQKGKKRTQKITIMGRKNLVFIFLDICKVIKKREKLFFQWNGTEKKRN